MNIQFKKGVLELCVLSLLTRRDFYGYELVEHISKHINISEGTIYPLLRRFRKDGYVTNYLQESQEGPPRKYYKITEEGKKAFKELEKEWENFTIRVNKIIRGDFVE
ncbi:Transcriptional regulator, PadR-like family [[Clostridium] ultunense Esp]|uniref:Transcriptional regulator, PadR-like family n=1 Tax=[Clostridium] ultunense Esp TaxID=1288971 RepID=M1ZGD7_9FIRM|nr:PadR family transcriptional regulator [Schnuerera ultunensis]CCQ92822.1 Transcriptional regulator, PadR-like family [[Clostridium] ultunense Esp]SHD75836.1 Transcriptional regulator, PadR-like family [[Clostridium] ultunense Esp]